MKYVCLVYLVEKEMEAMSESEAEACTDESLAYDEALRGAASSSWPRPSRRSRRRRRCGSGGVS